MDGRENSERNHDIYIYTPVTQLAFKAVFHGIAQNMEWTGTGLILIYIFKCFAPQGFHSRKFYVQISTFTDDLNL